MMANSEDIPFWNRPHWERLTAPGAALTHGLLFHGLPGLGKSELAQAFAGHLLAAGTPDPRQALALFHGGNHPDMHVLMSESEAAEDNGGLLARYAQRYFEPESRKGAKPKRAITVGQVRTALEAVFSRPYVSQGKVFVILSAHALNVNAANALLKVLEEPPRDTTLLLVSSRPHLLPATVRSRLVRFEFRAPPSAQALAWLRERLPRGADATLLLRLAHGAPVLALQLAAGDTLQRREEFFASLEALRAGRADALAMAESWQEAGLENTLQNLTGFAADLARAAACDRPPVLSNPDRFEWAAKLAPGLDARQLFRFADRLAQARRFADAPLDTLLQLEELALVLADFLRGGGTATVGPASTQVL